MRLAERARREFRLGEDGLLPYVSWSDGSVVRSVPVPRASRISETSIRGRDRTRLPVACAASPPRFAPRRRRLPSATIALAHGAAEGAGRPRPVTPRRRRRPESPSRCRKSVASTSSAITPAATTSRSRGRRTASRRCRGIAATAGSSSDSRRVRPSELGRRRTGRLRSLSAQSEIDGHEVLRTATCANLWTSGNSSMSSACSARSGWASTWSRGSAEFCKP